MQLQARTPCDVRLCRADVISAEGWGRRRSFKVLDAISWHGPTGTRDVNFPEFYFSIRELQNSRLVEYSKLTWHSASMMHLMGECCNSVDITPRGCGWEVERRTGICGGVKLQSVPISLMYSSYRQTAVILDSLHAVAVIAQQWIARVALIGWGVCS